ncbi:MAG: translocation/assembly module TamB domain-containing protein [Chthoniobacterales bacterium]
MGDDGKSTVQPHRSRSWIRRLLIALGIISLLLVVFHAPILRAVFRAVAVRVAAGQNLKIDFQLEGDPLDQVTLRNVRATPTGPSLVQTLDVGIAKVDYSLPALLFHGMPDALKNVEVHDVTAVLDSSKAPIPPPSATPKPNQKLSLPAFFPDRLEATNVNLTLRQQPEDIVIKNLNLGLYQNREGRLQIEKVQIPGVHIWTNISATTAYTNKNLLLHNLTLDENNRLQVVNVDASKLSRGKLGLKLQGGIGGGNIASQMELSAHGSSYETNTQLQASDISLGQLAQYLGHPAGKLAGDVKNVKVDLHGNLDAPSSWRGTISADLENVRQGGLALDRVTLDVQAANGTATVREARIDQGNNHLQLRGSIDLPKNREGFGRTPGNLQFSIDAPDLEQLTAFLHPPARGSLQASGNLKVENQTLHFDLTASGEQIDFQGVSVGKLSAKISAAKKMSPPNEKQTLPIYDGLTSSIQADLTDVRYGDFAIDQVKAVVKSEGAKVSLGPLTAMRKNNLLRVNGGFQLPPPNEKLINQPADLQFSLRAPQLSDYWQSEAPNKATGELQADGSVRLRRGAATGQISVFGEQIAIDKLVVRQLSAQTTIANDTFYLNDLTATLNERDYLKGHGTVQLQKPFRYAGAMTLNLADLSTFEPLLATAGKKTPLAGSLTMDWSGQGELATLKNGGDLNLRLEHGRYSDLQNLEAKVEAHYTPEEINVPIIYLGSDKLSFQAIARAKDSQLEIDKIQIDQGSAKYANAYASIPFTWRNLGSGRPLVPPVGKVTINFQSANLDITKLFQNLGAKPPVSGELTVKLDVQGPLDQLEANLDLQMQNLKAAAVRGLEPAKIDLAMHFKKNELNILGKIQQPKIQTVQIDARLPLDISRMLEKRKLDEQTPISAKVQMPRSSINFVREFVPGLRQLDGSLGLELNVGGTIAQPVLRGAADMNINVVRFENPTLPALTNFKGQLNFHDNTLSFERFGGDLAGGPFTISGRVTLSKLTEPNLDLRLVANSILVARNDNLTARVDADIRVEGPLKSATVRGQVLTTNSRFFKNIDIIPIALPGRPAPHPRPPSTAPTLSFPDPPLRDWKFDLTIKSKDPFLIRGNLANGRAIVDMKIAGTGLHPKVEGQVRLENFEATLPFSTLKINLGFLYFDPDDPLNPRIEMQGTSLLRDYTIRVYVYGTATAPQAIFSSEPPLPQEEIISLLATGATREELTSGSNVLASRAAFLVVKELYRKIFKNGNEAPTNENFFDRLDVEFGNIDPRTGEQTTTATFRVNDHFVLIGNLGVQGQFRGLVKYLIRFR